MSVERCRLVASKPCRLVGCDRDTCSTVQMDEFFTIPTTRGVKFTVVYGYREYLYGDYSETPVVAFYDRRFEGHTQYGQFVSDCNRETLMERQKGYDLELSGGNPDWTIDATTMYVIMAWLNHMVWQEEN